MPKKLRKWHFLLLGGSLILLSAYLWYWNWRTLGIPSPLRPEHYLTMVCFVVGIGVLGLFIYRLTRRQVTIMLVMMIIANLLAALVTLWISRSIPSVFTLLCPRDYLVEDAAYLSSWRQFFLTPALYLMHGGLLVLWFVTLVMFLVRKPGDQPE
jgi:DMSO reductase anchor subunit